MVIARRDPDDLGELETKWACMGAVFRACRVEGVSGCPDLDRVPLLGGDRGSISTGWPARTFLVPGRDRSHPIEWTNTYTGEAVAGGIITADMEGPDEGWLRVRVGELNQRITLRALPHHFGGRQWYFRCPATQRRCSVLWMPAGARHFCSRQAWRKQVAYALNLRAPRTGLVAGRRKSSPG